MQQTGFEETSIRSAILHTSVVVSKNESLAFSNTFFAVFRLNQFVTPLAEHIFGAFHDVALVHQRETMAPSTCNEDI